MAQDIRIAILGTGHMAQTFAIALASIDGVTLAGFCSRDIERAKAMATYHGAPASYGGIDEILADPAVDALYIANDNAGHAAAAIAALEAGKAVLCEKPCGIDAAEAAAIAKTAARTGQLFMEAIPTPFIPAVAAILETARKGDLGQIRRFAADFGYVASPQSHPGCFSPIGGGVLLDRGIYLATLALLVMGPAIKVQAEILKAADGIDVEAWINLTHEGGATSVLGTSLTCELPNRLDISGTSGSAWVEAPLLAAERYGISHHGLPQRAQPSRGGFVSRLKQKPTLRRALSVLRAARSPQLSYGHSLYRGEIEHFRDLLRSGATESPVLPASLSVAAMTILDQARASAS
ncbi:MAG: Gfo/Idh/MocA family oxidoreductase [Sphingobium sp.]|nr:Gfo/Idh/MocA family oxidoreductase [Sphingobium sp.]